MRKALYHTSERRKVRVKIGSIENKVFTQFVTFFKGYFREASALGVDTCAMQPCIEKGVERVNLVCTDIRKVYRIDFNKFIKKSWVQREYEGFHPKVFCRVDWWDLFDKRNRLLKKGKPLEKPKEIKIAEGQEHLI